MTNQLIFKNNANSVLQDAISPTATTANIAAGSGVLFPNPGAGQAFNATFTDAATGLLREIVQVTNVTGDTITMIRAQEGTTALSWQPNDPFAQLVTAGDLGAMVQAIQAQQQTYNYAVDTGATNAYIVGLTPALAAPVAGMPIRVLIENSNTGPSTLNPGSGAAAIVRRDGSALIGGELLAGYIAEFQYNGTAYEFMGVAPATAAAITAGTDTQSYVTPEQLGNASFAPTGSFLWSAAIATPTGYIKGIGGTTSRTGATANLFATITKSAPVTLTIATPGVVNWTLHGLVAGDVVSFETTGSLPTGISIGVDYYVLAPSTNSFTFAATPGGAAIATSGSQTGVQTCRNNPYGCGDGTTTFGIPDGRGRVLAAPDASAGRLGANTSLNGFVTAALGNSAGEQAHTQVVGELVGHTHVAGNGGSSAGSGGGSGFSFANPAGVSGSTGGGAAANVTQPTLIANLFIKL